MSDLNHRARKILGAIVHEYLATGEAVGSRTVTRRYGIDSVAGDGAQRHERPRGGGPAQAAAHLGGARPDRSGAALLRRLAAQGAHALGTRSATSCRSATTSRRTTSTRRCAKRPRCCPSCRRTPWCWSRRAPRPTCSSTSSSCACATGQLLAVLVTKSGQVQNKIVTTAEPVDADELERIHNYLNDVLGGLTLDEVRARVQEELPTSARSIRQLREEGARAVAAGAARAAARRRGDHRGAGAPAREHRRRPTGRASRR